jgi:hypothetical protein
MTVPNAPPSDAAEREKKTRRYPQFDVLGTDEEFKEDQRLILKAGGRGLRTHSR